MTSKQSNKKIKKIKNEGMGEGAWEKEHERRSMGEGAWEKEHGRRSMREGA